MSSGALLTQKKTGKDYGYSNARVRGMRSRLFSNAYFDQLMDAADLNRIIQMLMDTEYSSDLEERIVHGRTSAQVDEALKSNMLRTFNKVMSFANGEAFELLTTLLGRWDLFNLKTIIRGAHMHLDPEEIEESLFAVGQLSSVDLHELSRTGEVRAVVDTLVTWGSPFAAALKPVVAEYMKSNDLALLELALDRYYGDWASKRLEGKGANSKLARRLLGIQVDSTNLLTVFRLQKADMEGLEVERFFLPGGVNISKDLFMQLAPLSDVDEVLERLKRTPYGSQLDAVVLQYVEENSIAVFERALEDFVMRKAVKAGTGDPLGVGIIIGYLWAKQNEVTNLRIVVKGKAVGMPPDRMRRELIVV